MPRDAARAAKWNTPRHQRLEALRCLSTEELRARRERLERAVPVNPLHLALRLIEIDAVLGERGASLGPAAAEISADPVS
jgi:hypothetical protein